MNKYTLLAVGLLAACSAETATQPGDLAGAGGKADDATESTRLRGRSLLFSESVEDRVTQLSLSPADGETDLYLVIARRSASSPLGGGPAAMERVVGDRMTCFIHGIDLACSQDDTPVDGPRVQLSLRTTDGLVYEATTTTFNPWTGSTTEERIAGHLEASSLCGDGQPALCEIVPPECPDGTILTEVGGCFGPCVNPVSCTAPVEAQAYDPCGDKQCGDSCTICPPGDPDCFETAVLKMCQPDGQCSASFTECTETAN